LNISLNGTWSLFLDEQEIGIKTKWFSPNWIDLHLAEGRKIEIPSAFNLIPELERYSGILWFIAKLPEIPYRPKSHEYSLEFEGVNYYSEVWLNGHNLGRHEGGHLPFRCEFSPRILSFTKNNYLAVKVDPSLHENGIPSNNLHLFNWGGIHRNVKLLILEKTRVKRIKISNTIEKSNGNCSIINVDFVLLNPQEFLDRCYAEQKEPQIEFELYYLGQFIKGAQQFNKVLIQTGIQDINPESLQALKHIKHDEKSLQNYFADATQSNENFDEPIDLEHFFANSEELISSRDGGDGLNISDKNVQYQEAKSKVLGFL